MNTTVHIGPFFWHFGGGRASLAVLEQSPLVHTQWNMQRVHRRIHDTVTLACHTCNQQLLSETAVSTLSLLSPHHSLFQYHNLFFWQTVNRQTSDPDDSQAGTACDWVDELCFILHFILQSSICVLVFKRNQSTVNMSWSWCAHWCNSLIVGQLLDLATVKATSGTFFLCCPFCFSQ